MVGTAHCAGEVSDSGGAVAAWRRGLELTLVLAVNAHSGAAGMETPLCRLPFADSVWRQAAACEAASGPLREV